jgi:hypothetical protein
MKFRDRLRAAAAALLFPDVIDDRGRAAVVAIERKIAAMGSELLASRAAVVSMAREITGYRIALGSILQRRATNCCPECKKLDGHEPGCDHGAAEKAMTEGALLRAERGDTEGKA